MRPRLSIETYVEGVRSGDRAILSRCITLIESRLDTDRQLAQAVLTQLLPFTGQSLRLGITGVPGVGKSTLIEALGMYLVGLDKRVAVLAIDPSSQRTGGSLLGDKTRMEVLATHPLAYIRPSAARGALGGVADRTREALLLCEAAGFEIIIIETVGVGQSETLVRSMVDFFLLLMLAGAGDELQGIKKGIMEMADAIAITKADGANKPLAQEAVREYQNALHLLAPAASGWSPPVLTCSALAEEGIAAIWEVVMQYHNRMQANGFWELTRQQQNVDWMHSYIRQMLEENFRQHPAVRASLSEAEESVRTRQELPIQAARRLLEYTKTS